MYVDVEDGDYCQSCDYTVTEHLSRLLLQLLSHNLLDNLLFLDQKSANDSTNRKPKSVWGK